VEKFHWLSEPFADAELRNNIVETVTKIDQNSIEHLMGLLERASPKAVFKASHPGIQ
jgi:2-methylcitrate dehydratase